MAKANKKSIDKLLSELLAPIESESADDPLVARQAARDAAGAWEADGCETEDDWSPED